MISQVLYLLVAALPLCAQVAFTRGNGRIDVQIDGKPYTSFFLSSDGNKPYIYPLRTAAGDIVTRHFPMEQFPGETNDHPHQRGLFFAHGEVNGYNFWATEPGMNNPRQARMALKEVDVKGGKKSGSILAVFEGLDPRGKAILTETRTITFYSDPKLRMLDYEIKIDPIETLKFGDTKEGTFGIRIATSMTEDKGGRMVNAEGGQTEKNVWGKRSAWVDYYGPVRGRTVGIAIMDHTSNPRHPTKDGSLTVERGQSLRFRYRVVIHPGDVHAINLAALYQEFSTSAGQEDWANDPDWVKTRYGGWGGPGVSPGPGPMDDVRLKDYAPKSSLAIAETSVLKAKFPAIDVHAHVNARTPQQVADWVRTMDEAGVEKTVILTGAIGAQFDALVELYLKPYPSRFVLFCGIDTKDINRPDYPERAAAELARCYRKGARGTGELSDKGWGFGGSTNIPRDGRLHPDDPRLDPFWNKCAELKIPANIHVSDHPSAWQPPDVYQERTPDYQHFNQTGKDVPSYAELIGTRDKALAKHPKTTFIACHLGNQGNDLTTLGKVLDMYRNLYLDFSARDYELGRTPRAALRFLTKYRDRVMFGTDMGRELSMYRAWWRLLESADEFMPGRVWWRYYGLELPTPVLDALYRGTAKKVLKTAP